MTRRRKVKFAITFVIFSIVALCVYRGTGTGYVWAVSGVRIPWPRERTEHYDCDFGQYSVFQLQEDSMKGFMSDHPWNMQPADLYYENDCLMFRLLSAAQPLPSRDDLIWMKSPSKHQRWKMYLHVPTRRVFVAITYEENLDHQQ